MDQDNFHLIVFTARVARDIGIYCHGNSVPYRNARSNNAKKG